MPAVAPYAALLALLFVLLSPRTIRLRRRHRTALGDGGHGALQKVMRTHANFAEYMPLALLPIYFVVRGGRTPFMVHVLGIALIAGRLLHAWGISQPQENFRFRVSGMVLTFTTLITATTIILMTPPL
jgi:uncharacterized membrane protein YecN with MAPEG domain